MKNQEQKIYPSMREIDVKDYLNFLKDHDFVIIENQKVKLQKKWEITERYHSRNRT